MASVTSGYLKITLIFERWQWFSNSCSRCLLVRGTVLYKRSGDSSNEGNRRTERRGRKKDAAVLREGIPASPSSFFPSVCLPRPPYRILGENKKGICFHLFCSPNSANVTQIVFPNNGECILYTCVCVRI